VQARLVRDGAGHHRVEQLEVQAQAGLGDAHGWVFRAQLAGAARPIRWSTAARRISGIGLALGACSSA
jgi:hypothetical protein